MSASSPQDNGSGMPHKDIPDMLGRVLSGTKYGVKQVCVCVTMFRSLFDERVSPVMSQSGVLCVNIEFASIENVAVDPAHICTHTHMHLTSIPHPYPHPLRPQPPHTFAPTSHPHLQPQTRGKFGLGAKMALIWSKMTTGLPFEIR